MYKNLVADSYDCLIYNTPICFEYKKSDACLLLIENIKMLKTKSTGKGKKENRKTWSKSDLESALSEITAGNSIRQTAKKYGMTDGILRYKLKQRSSGIIANSAGRPTTLDSDEEKRLAEVIGTLCKLGFSPTRQHIKDLVKDYVESHNLENTFSR